VGLVECIDAGNRNPGIGFPMDAEAVPSSWAGSASSWSAGAGSGGTIRRCGCEARAFPRLWT